MDIYLFLKFIEDKTRNVEDLGYHLQLACPSSLKTIKNSPSLIVMTHEGMIDTHGSREDPLAMMLHEDNSKL